jgi:LacI family transcriptional regulator
MARVRISDVAAAAGVSTATVSLVLNDQAARISERTRDRVRRAAADVGYSPNSVARGLRTQRTRTVGLVSDTIATTPFAGRMLAGAQDVAREHGYLVFLVDTDADPVVERQAIHALADQRVDAMIYACMVHQVVDVPPSLPSRSVFLDCRPATGAFPAVVPDDRAGAATAVRELIAAGHRRIGYLDVEQEDRPLAAGLRHEGYLEAHAEAGVVPDPALHVHGAISAAGGRRATDLLLDLPHGRRPTGIFCFNDRMAVGAYTAAYHRGLLIPRDLSVVGYDDQQFVAADLDPPLTTVALPHYEMGRWAMEVALAIRATDDGRPHLMPCPMIHRGSVGPAPDTATDHRGHTGVGSPVQPAPALRDGQEQRW